MSHWTLCQYEGIDHLEKSYTFKKYSKSLCFLNAVAGLAESYIHHPRMVIEWGKVTVAWGTHESDEGSGVLARDRHLAQETDRLFELLQAREISGDIQL
ncbi:4a-hydroxytetrahydrobiopterin dehydratase [Endozoicomonas sp. 4G]|uniref:4a-hydroxytetrahydrobiopterin dehydratase n=1 Tax=Endozoicomonas sp. 4G TaxID=2872754 RepID=UPI0020786A9E|nr:4a-hydroxytetrahydrobiopterin dehydratase [Endozoicomonas sp. 4G]